MKLKHAVYAGLVANGWHREAVCFCLNLAYRPPVTIEQMNALKWVFENTELEDLNDEERFHSERRNFRILLNLACAKGIINSHTLAAMSRLIEEKKTLLEILDLREKTFDKREDIRELWEEVK